MLKVQYMKPFYTKITGSKLRLVFAYQYFSITKEDEAFHFIPIEGKEILVDLDSMHVENLTEVFVFQRGNRFIRLPLYQLLLMSNVHNYLMPLIEVARGKSVEEKQIDAASLIGKEGLELTYQFELMNLSTLIDEALDNRDKARFDELTEKRKALLSKFTALTHP